MKNVKKIIVCSLFIVILMPGKKGLSHPHVFIAQKLHVVFDENGLSGIKVFWQFDDMFSSMIINDHDLNQNGRFEPDEVLSVKENAFPIFPNLITFFPLQSTEPLSRWMMSRILMRKSYTGN